MNLFLNLSREFLYVTDLTNKAKQAFAKYNLAYPRLLNAE